MSLQLLTLRDENVPVRGQHVLIVLADLFNVLEERFQIVEGLAWVIVCLLKNVAECIESGHVV